MRPLDIVALDPCVQIILQLGERAVDLLAEGYAIKLVEHGFVEAFDDTVRLRALCLRSGVINIFDREVEFIFVMLGIAGKRFSEPLLPLSV